MSIEALAQEAFPFALRLSKPFRKTLIRVGVLIEGPHGWGEFAPFPEYDDQIAGRWLAGALEAACTTWPEPIRQVVPINAIVPALDPAATQITTEQAIARGITTFKVKVAQHGQTLDDDIERVTTVRKVLNRADISGEIRIDANQAWSLEDALQSIAALNSAAGVLDYVEQPCESLLDNKQVRNELGVRIAIDEGIRMASEIDLGAIREAADVIILKAIPVGGVTRAMDIARTVDLPAVVSGSLDSSVGLASGLALAGALPNLYGACGLGTGSLFAQDLTPLTVLPENGELPVIRTAPDQKLLNESGSWVTADEAEWWRDRIVRAWYSSAHELVTDDIREVVEKW